MKPVKISQEDLSTIVNGQEEDAGQNRPFNHVFTKENKLRAWSYIGYIPFKRKCIENKKVHHELQESKSSAVGTNMESLAMVYEESKSKLKSEGFNHECVDLSTKSIQSAKRENIRGPSENVG